MITSEDALIQAWKILGPEATEAQVDEMADALSIYSFPPQLRHTLCPPEQEGAHFALLLRHAQALRLSHLARLDLTPEQKAMLAERRA